MGCARWSAASRSHQPVPVSPTSKERPVVLRVRAVGGAKTAAPLLVGASRTSYVQLPNRSAGALRDRSSWHRVVRFCLRAAFGEKGRPKRRVANFGPRSRHPRLRCGHGSQALQISLREAERELSERSATGTRPSLAFPVQTGAQTRTGTLRESPAQKGGANWSPGERPRARGPVSAPVRPSWPGGPAAHPERRGRAYRPPRHR